MNVQCNADLKKEVQRIMGKGSDVCFFAKHSINGIISVVYAHDDVWGIDNVNRISRMMNGTSNDVRKAMEELSASPHCVLARTNILTVDVGAFIGKVKLHVRQYG